MVYLVCYLASLASLEICIFTLGLSFCEELVNVRKKQCKSFQYSKYIIQYEFMRLAQRHNFFDIMVVIYINL